MLFQLLAHLFYMEKKSQTPLSVSFICSCVYIYDDSQKCVNSLKQIILSIINSSREEGISPLLLNVPRCMENTFYYPVLYFICEKDLFKRFQRFASC